VDRPIQKKRFTPQRIALGLGIVAFLVFAVRTLLNGNQSSLNVTSLLSLLVLYSRSKPINSTL